MFQWSFKWVPIVFERRDLQGSFKFVSRVFQGSLMGGPRKILGCFKEVSRIQILGCVKGVPMVFEESFKEV